MKVSLQLIEPEAKPTRGSPRSAKAKAKAKEKDAFVAEGVQTLEEQEPPAPIGRGRRVLVVDDNPVILKAFELKLKANGFAVTTSTDGAAVARTAEQTKAELIILDINFPTQAGLEWSGFTIMQWVRRFPELAGIPVILITGGDSKDYEEKSRASGAVGFFQKPVAFKELLSVMVATLARCPETPAPTPTPPLPAPSGEAPPL